MSQRRRGSLGVSALFKSAIALGRPFFLQKIDRQVGGRAPTPSGARSNTLAQEPPLRLPIRR